MKKIILIKTIIIAFCPGLIINTAIAQNDADPAITSLSFSVSPVEISHETELTVFVTNGGFTTAVPAGSIGLSVILPIDGEYAAFPESLAAVSGDYMNKFNWTYNSSSKTFYGVSNQEILPGDGGTIVINIRGYIVSSSTNSQANIVLLDPPSYPNDNVTNNSLTATLDVTPGGTLPLKLFSFNAAKQNNVAKLNWETSSEVKSSHFDVQTSNNGTNWTSIGTVQAAGNSDIKKQYSFIHSTPLRAVNYYRLKVVDIDGKYGYSDTRTVGFNTNSTITVLPNPTANEVYITSANATTIKIVLVYSTEGKLMQTADNFTSGSSVDLSGYATGVYLLKIIYKDESTQVERVIKQ